MDKKTAKSIEAKILRCEGFEVAIIDPQKNGRNVRSDCAFPTDYKPTTVDDFKKRFIEQYPQYDISVYKADGSKASPQMQLCTVRATYAQGKED